MAKTKKKNKKKKNNNYNKAAQQDQDRRGTKTFYRVGAMILVIALIVGIIAMYGLSYTG